ncbi:MAG TPA: hypothetical protein VEI50_03440 [Nitrospiraceae bacterium]|nr:hypothetical protein [Nitrospiraceae bacterium]
MDPRFVLRFRLGIVPHTGYPQIYHRAEQQKEMLGGDRDVGALQRCRVEVETDAYQKIVDWRYQSECY